MKKPTTRQVLKTINNYVVFFLTVGFAVLHGRVCSQLLHDAVFECSRRFHGTYL